MKSRIIEQKDFSDKRILVCVPAYVDMDALFVQSFVQLKYPCICAVQFIKNTLISEARNTFADNAIENGYDYVLFLDSDMVFPRETVEKLLYDDVDIVSGIYFKRVPPFSPIVYKTLRLQEHKLEFEDIGMDYERDALIECEGIGAGCVLIKTEVLKAVKDKYGPPFNIIPGIGEDFSFCLRAREMGYKIYCDTSIKCGHIANIVVREGNAEVLNSIDNPQF